MNQSASPLFINMFLPEEGLFVITSMLDMSMAETYDKRPHDEI